MNFFVDQQRAKEQTRRLVILYAFTVVLTALSTGLIFALYFLLDQPEVSGHSLLSTPFLKALFTHPVLWYASGLICVMVVLVSVFEIIKLKQGGKVIARYAGAQPVPPETKDFKFRQYINIVQEMSIASGIPCPHIYFMPTEKSINAFAAGFDINDAVVAVSRGALDELDRDELQGVVAHEFSHIFNGDMLLNLKLMGYLAGLTSISHLGSRMMRSGRVSRKDNKNQAALIGLVILLIGIVGAFFATLIKAAVSRQREFLADASAVQFTRNPKGISGALQKILKTTHQKITAPEADKISHFYFNNALPSSFSSQFSLFSTHPPLLERIKKIDREFNVGQYRRKKRLNDQRHQRDQMVTLLHSSPTLSASPRNVFDQLGDQLGDFLHTGRMVMTFSLGFFLSPEQSKAHYQVAGFSKIYPSWNPEQLMNAYQKIRNLKYDEQLASLDLVAYYLKNLSENEQTELLKAIESLMTKDGITTPIEILYYLFFKNVLRPRKNFIDHSFSLERVRADVEVALCFCLELDSDQDKAQLFEKFSKEIFGHVRPHPHLSVELVDKSLNRLKQADPEVKKNILNTVALIVYHNDIVTAHERLFLSLFTQVLGVPTSLTQEESA